VVLAPAAPADAAKKKSKKVVLYPTVSKVSPTKVAIGEVMTITGKGFLKGKGKNTVVFRRSGKRSVFAKADGLSTTRLRLRVPEKLGTFLSRQSGKTVGTRFQIRVLARRFGKRYTVLKKSPTILPAKKVNVATGPSPVVLPAPAPTATAAAAPPSDCDGDGQIDDVDADDDNDLLPDTLEAQLGTNRCLADTDGDGMEDGWEYQSATDLNQVACPAAVYPTYCAPARPYPGKVHYPNPLDPKDGAIDFDGDWLEAALEYQAWKRKGAADAAYRTLTNMWYSDGFQASQDTSSADGCRGIAAAHMPAPYGGLPIYGLDRHNFLGHGVGCLTDDERDEDGDLLTNLDETHGAMSGPGYWAGVYKEIPYRVAYRGTNWLDPDTDGDGVIDGLDDQDGDDFRNIEEIMRGAPVVLDGTDTNEVDGLWVDPFNPCLPAIESQRCPRQIPADANTAWAPFTEPRPQTRWPLYATGYPDVDKEIWGVESGGLETGPVARADQTLPPPHPLPR